MVEHTESSKYRYIAAESSRDLNLNVLCYIKMGRLIICPTFCKCTHVPFYIMDKRDFQKSGLHLTCRHEVMLIIPPVYLKIVHERIQSSPN